MKTATFLSTLPLLGALALAPQAAPAQVSVTLHLGNPIVVTHYAPEVYGDWHTSYRTWRPVTVWYYDGHYYPRAVRGGRPVQIYQRGNERFLPPQDQGWANRGDRRYNYNRRPNDEDYQHAAPPPAPRSKPGRGRGRP